jgi:hypothetical protein
MVMLDEIEWVYVGRCWEPIAIRLDGVRRGCERLGEVGRRLVRFD